MLTVTVTRGGADLHPCYGQFHKKGILTVDVFPIVSDSVTSLLECLVTQKKELTRSIGKERRISRNSSFDFSKLSDELLCINIVNCRSFNLSGISTNSCMITKASVLLLSTSHSNALVLQSSSGSLRVGSTLKQEIKYLTNPLSNFMRKQYEPFSRRRRRKSSLSVSAGRSVMASSIKVVVLT